MVLPTVGTTASRYTDFSSRYDNMRFSLGSSLVSRQHLSKVALDMMRSVEEPLDRGPLSQHHRHERAGSRRDGLVCQRV